MLDRTRVWKRFVDDVIVVVKKDGGQPLLQHLNSQHPRIKFRMEDEKDGTLPFMDVRFTPDVQGKLMREVYLRTIFTHFWAGVSDVHMYACLRKAYRPTSHSQGA